MSKLKSPQFTSHAVNWKTHCLITDYSSMELVAARKVGAKLFVKSHFCKLVTAANDSPWDARYQAPKYSNIQRCRIHTNQFKICRVYLSEFHATDTKRSGVTQAVSGDRSVHSRIPGSQTHELAWQGRESLFFARAGHSKI